MTNRQKRAYGKGHEDRKSGRPMVPSYEMSPHVANAYANGYRDACALFTPSNVEG